MTVSGSRTGADVVDFQIVVAATREGGIGRGMNAHLYIIYMYHVCVFLSM